MKRRGRTLDQRQKDRRTAATFLLMY